MTTSRNCIHCKKEINPLRVKALPNTKTCVDCSTTGAKVAMQMTFGEKDHTWNEVMFIEPEEYQKIKSIKDVPLDELDDEEK